MEKKGRMIVLFMILLFFIAGLELSGCKMKKPIRIKQRSTVDVPGLEGKVKIRVGDIEVGAAPISIVTSDDKIIKEISIYKRKESFVFGYNGSEHEVKVTDIEHHFFGEDWIEVRIKKK